MVSNISRWYIFFMLGWFFLLQGKAGSGSIVSDYNTKNSNMIIGPFISQEICQKIAKEASEDFYGTPYRSTSCWEVKEK